MTTIDALQWVKDNFKQITSQDSLDLLQAVTHKQHWQLLAGQEISDAQFNKFAKQIGRRAKNQPIDYLIGHTMFNGVKVLFNKRTLTPRKETEILSEMVIAYIKTLSGDVKVLDLCAGSGCIGCSIAKHTDAKVTAADISRFAIKHIKQTAKLNGVSVRVVKSNMLKNIYDKYDIIVCNPPYIDKPDMLQLEKEVIDFDPKLALYGGEEGMEFYKYLSANVDKNLAVGGKIFLELDAKNALRIKEMFNAWEVDIVKDYAGLNRFLVGQLK